MAYGSGQKAAFAGLGIGFCMCLTGAIAPNWQQGSISIMSLAATFKQEIHLTHSTKVFEMFGGLWWYCVDLIGNCQCDTYDIVDDKQTTDWIIRIACVVNVLLTLLCGLVALCRACCCAGGKTICHGITVALAGGAGLLAGGIFSGTTSDGFNLPLVTFKFGWAFYVYMIGASIVTFCSFILCCASAGNPVTPVIINSVNRVFPNNRYTQMSDVYTEEAP